MNSNYNIIKQLCINNNLTQLDTYSNILIIDLSNINNRQTYWSKLLNKAKFSLISFNVRYISDYSLFQTLYAIIHTNELYFVYRGQNDYKLPKTN